MSGYNRSAWKVVASLLRPHPPYGISRIVDRILGALIEVGELFWALSVQ